MYIDDWHECCASHKDQGSTMIDHSVKVHLSDLETSSRHLLLWQRDLQHIQQVWKLQTLVKS